MNERASEPMKPKAQTFQKVSLFIISISVKMSSTILLGFTIPRLLGVVQFGYFRFFALLSVYTTLLHLGLIDGFRLSLRKEGNVSDNPPTLPTVLKALLWLEGLLASVGMLLSLIFLKAELQQIAAMVFLNLLVQNFITLYQTLAQTSGLSKKVSQGSLLLSFLNIVIVGLVFLFDIRDFFWFTLLVVIANYWVFLWYFWIFRRLLFEKSHHNLSIISTFKSLSKRGFWPLIASSLLTLVVAFNNHLVWFLVPIHDFSIYAFSINMTIFATFACANLTNITDGFFAKLTPKAKIESYDLLNGVVLFLVLLGISAYFLLQWTTPTFLPDYVASIPIFRIVLGLLLFSCPLGVVTHAFYKFSGRNTRYIRIGAILVLISIGIDLLAYHFFQSLEAMAFSLFGILALWYVITQIDLIRILKIPWLKSDLFLLVGGGLYLLISEMDDYVLGALIYLPAILLVFACFYGRDWKKGKALMRVYMEQPTPIPHFEE